MYFSLIKAVRAHLPALHRYVALRKKVLNVEKLHLYDLNVPLVADVELGMPYSDAVKEIVDSALFWAKSMQRLCLLGLPLLVGWISMKIRGSAQARIQVGVTIVCPTF